MDAHLGLKRDLLEAALTHARGVYRGLSMEQVVRDPHDQPATRGPMPAAFGAAGARGAGVGNLSASGPPWPQLPPRVGDSFSEGALEILVDIYVSAGIHSAAPGRSCDHNDKSTCSLWRIQMSLPSKVVLRVEQVQSPSDDTGGGCPGGRSHVQPAVRRDGARYAWQRNCLDTNGDSLSSAIVETGLPIPFVPDPTINIVDETTVFDDHIMYPNWYSDDILLMSASTTRQVVYWVYDWTGARVKTTGYGMAGPAHADKDYSDPHSHPSPTYSGAPGSPRVVTFGGDRAVGEHTPRVTDILGGSEEPFLLPGTWPSQPNELAECHHPAWSPEGDRILCTRYQHAEEYKGGFDATPASTTYGLRRLFQFESDGAGSWVPSGSLGGEPGALVEPLTGTEFDSIPEPGSGLFPPRENGDIKSGGCRTYVWKFAEWCVRERFLVATVYCTTGVDWDTSEEAIHSRVVLIDTNDTSTAAAYTDLTSILEDYLNSIWNVFPRGFLSGFFGSCGPSPDLPFGGA